MTIAFPYRVPSGASVQPGAWLLVRGERPVPVPPLLPDWDCGTNLDFSREIVLDLEHLLAETGLPGEAADLEVVVQWRVSDSLLTGTAFRSRVTAASTSVPVEISLEGRQLGGTLSLITSLLLATNIAGVSGPRAALAGSVLWRDEKKVRLTGDASRLPIAVVDFRTHRRDPVAPWSVVIEGPLDAPAMGTIQLLLNSRRADIVSLVEGNGDPAVARAVRSALYVAVGRALVEHALLEDELSDDAQFDDDTLGSVLLGTVSGRFDRTLDELRTLRAQEPEAFTSLIDGKLGLLQDAVG